MHSLCATVDVGRVQCLEREGKRGVEASRGGGVCGADRGDAAEGVGAGRRRNIQVRLCLGSWLGGVLYEQGTPVATLSSLLNQMAPTAMVKWL